MNTAQDRIRDDLNRLAVVEAERPYVRTAGVEALQRLLPVAQRCTGQSRIVGRFLLGLYNGSAFPFSLTDLRGLDSALWEDCLAVLRLDRRPEQEVQEYIENGEEIWSHLKRAWG